MNKVKYDHNPKNDYDDGYNAGRRFVKKLLKKLKIEKLLRRSK